MDNGQLTIDNAMQRDDAQSIVNYLIVPNPLKSPAKLAEQHRNQFQIPVIGISGKQRQDRCERMAAPVAQSGTCHYPFSPQL